MKELARGHMVSGSGAIWNWVWLEAKRREGWPGLSIGCNGTDWVWSWKRCLDGEEKAVWTGIKTWAPGLLPLPSRGTYAKHQGPPLGGKWHTCLPEPLLTPLETPSPGLVPTTTCGSIFVSLSGHACTLRSQVSLPSRNQDVSQKRGRRGRGRTKPQHKKTGAHFSPNSPWEGTHCSHGCWVSRQSHVHPGEMQGSHWKAALSLELTSVHSCDVQRVLKGRVSILQTDPQKIMLPAPLSQPHQQNVPWKRGLLPTKLGSNPEAKYYSDAVLNQLVAIPSHSWQ